MWLIDHGASLGFQHAWSSSRASRLGLVDGPLARCLTRAVLDSTLDTVPDEWFLEDNDEARRRRRAAFVAFLWKRLKSPRPFVP